MDADSTSQSASTAPQARSCASCRQRRVRCDKQKPCSNCQRASIECIIPPSGRGPQKVQSQRPNARQLRAGQTDRELLLVDRLRKLEETVGKLSSHIQLQQNAGEESKAEPRTISSHRGLGALASHTNALGASGDRSKALPNEAMRDSFYVPHAFWERLNGELDSLRHDVSDETTAKVDDPNTVTPSQNELPISGGFGLSENHRAFMFGYDANNLMLQPYHPSASHAQVLWSIYQNSVEPLVKMVHVPTTDAILRRARQDPANLTPEEETLTFAIYYSALIATEPDEMPSKFGESTDTLLTRYRFAVEVSLARADFLSTSSLLVLQAVTLFLTTVRRVDDSLFCWTLTGLVIRIAKGLGLHRDGSHFGMAPFATEMRRRIWWAILVLDHRSSEEAGSDLIITEDDFDTRKPTNINDTDISPETTAVPIPREGRTDTATALARYEVLALSWRFPKELSIGDLGLNLVSCERLLVDAYERVEKRFLNKAAGQVEPLWSVTSLIVRIIVTKACLGLYESKVYSRDAAAADSYRDDPIRDRVFVTAIETVELGNLLYTDDVYKPFRWLFMTYTNWHAIALSLVEICRRPWSALVERSWKSVQHFDRNPVGLLKGSDNAAILGPLRGLSERARKHRKTELARLRSDQEACRQLNIAERSSPASARFSSIPGSDGRMDKFRSKWWDLVQQKDAERA